MATFTMLLKDVIETLYGTSYDPDDWEQPYESITYLNTVYGKLPVLPDYEKIGLAYYPIFDENYRRILNGKIIDEYFNQEIGTETIENFVLNLRKKMDQIMPYFNEFYETKRLSFDPLMTMDIHSVSSNIMEATENVESETTTETKTKSGARAVNSNFPQTMLAANADYATSGADTNSNSDTDGVSNQNNQSNANTENNSDSRVTGYQGNPSNLIQAYRNLIINIDTNIIDSVSDCFMQLLDNGDEVFASERYGW